MDNLHGIRICLVGFYGISTVVVIQWKIPKTRKNLKTRNFTKFVQERNILLPLS